MSEEFSYQGEELDLFAEAINWKRYFYRLLSPYMHGDVLEVGAGIGATTKYIHHHVRSWTCLEPDKKLAEQCQKNLQHLSPPIIVKAGTIKQAEGMFDCILYIDVLEHIRDDKDEVQLAAQHLKPEGKLLVLSPAHPFLYSPFDKSIGHFRRYNRASLRALTSPELDLHHIFYLDSVGLTASLANKVFLKEKMPTKRQIYFWDRVLIPCSRKMDLILGRKIGRSILGIWEKKK